MSALLGYFTTANADTPAFDPGLEVACPVCATPLARPMVTTSFLVHARPTRSYFFRAHKACWDSLDEHEQLLIESAFVDEIAASAKRLIVPLLDADLNLIDAGPDSDRESEPTADFQSVPTPGAATSRMPAQASSDSRNRGGAPRRPALNAEGDEMVCDRCGTRHGVVWFAPSDVWNAVMRGGDRAAADEFPFCCPLCFIQLAKERAIVTTGWLVTPFDDGPVVRAEQITLGPDSDLPRNHAEDGDDRAA